jgi:hypothetical protein
MGDREIQKEGVPIKGKSDVRALSVLRASFRHRLKARLTEKGNEEMKERSMASIDREAAKTVASQGVIWREVGAATARGERRKGRKKLETKAGSKTEIIIGEDELRSRGDSREPS